MCTLKSVMKIFSALKNDTDEKASDDCNQKIINLFD
jgi:hypothetical protein